MFERFTVQAREAVVGAQAEARDLGHGRIGTEHLLLALLREPGSEAAVVLEGRGVTRARVLERVAQAVDAGRGGERSGDRDSEKDSGIDEAALRSIGIDLDAVRHHLEESFGPGALDAPPPRRGWRERRRERRRGRQRRTWGHIAFSDRAKKALELSLREALRLGDNHIGVEHLLLGLVREGSGLGARVLVDLGVEPVQLRRDLEGRRRRSA